MSRSPERLRPAFRPGRVRSCLLGAVALLLACYLPANAQLSAGGVYAIQDARLVTVSGAVIEQGTIVVRDGLIEAVGRNVQAPPDAVVIDGRGLSIYPGFIDAFSQAGINLPPARERAPAPNIAQLLATDWFDPSAEDLIAWRRQGFTTALAARNDGLFSGQAALVNLSGDDTPSMTVRAPIIQVLTYSGQRGYPSTLMAVVAYQRQTLIDARYHDMLVTRYRRQPRGMVRPPHEPGLEALIPVASGQAPVLVEVSSESDLKRLRDLVGEFDLKVWITGAQEAYRVPELIKQLGAPVIVSLNFPTPERSTGYWFDRAYRNLSDEQQSSLDERDRDAIRSNPAVVHRSGVPFMLTPGGINPAQFWGNLRLAIQAGLPAGEALKALTITPARHFGVEGVLGTLEAGKIANLTVTRGDPFTEDSARITHLFVDGRMEVLAAATAPEAAPTRRPGQDAVIAGEWLLTISMPQSTDPVSLSLVQQQEQVTGAISTPMGSVSLRGTFQQGRLQMTGDIPEVGALSLSGNVRGATMTGTIGFGPMGEIAFTGSRRPSSPQPGEGGIQ